MSAATKPAPDEPNSDSKKSRRQESAIERKNREAEAERVQKIKLEAAISKVSQAALDFVERDKIPTTGVARMVVRSINDYKFRANFYVDHVIVWTKCLILKGQAVTLCVTQ